MIGSMMNRIVTNDQREILVDEQRIKLKEWQSAILHDNQMPNLIEVVKEMRDEIEDDIKAAN